MLLQSSSGDEAFNPDGLVPRCIRLLKDKFPDLVSWFSKLLPHFIVPFVICFEDTSFYKWTLT